MLVKPIVRRAHHLNSRKHHSRRWARRTMGVAVWPWRACAFAHPTNCCPDRARRAQSGISFGEECVARITRRALRHSAPCGL